MRKELKVAAENTHWWNFGLRAIYFDGPNTLECAIFHESLLCAYYVRNLLVEIFRDNLDASLLNRSPEDILREYSGEYPELCLILLNLVPFGPTSPYGAPWPLLLCANYIFGIFSDSPLYHADFYSKNIPIIRITHGVFTLGTNQPQFSTIDDVRDYYRDNQRIKEITRMCEFWIRKFRK